MSRKHRTTSIGVTTVSGVIALIGLVAAPAAADPQGSGGPLQRYEQLSSQADRLNEQINQAQVEVQTMRARASLAQADVARANDALASALAQENGFRKQVDQLTAASFAGAHVSTVSALLTSTSAEDFLAKAEDLNSLAVDDDAVLHQFRTAVSAAKTAETRAEHDRGAAKDAADTAQALVGRLTAQKARLRQQIDQVENALHALSPQQQTGLATDTGPAGTYVAPAGIAGRAMQIALDQVGKTYVYGGAGPDHFDCSGLILYAYAQAGKPGIPHSAAVQQGMGVAVSRANLRPGDLVFFGSPAYHDGIYVGNGLMVDAPHTGAVVRVEPLFTGYSGARRLSG
jgi:cell wall-associated NlpC family hydrolase